MTEILKLEEGGLYTRNGKKLIFFWHIW